ncbi:hypothetical protein SAMN05444143_102184 [Flavobacterium succinicans]|uniref:Uncharacterized protein n=1 Tax=Flavobacterium succinicans TaxID=29536 RepID=A0A1I4TM70_9FLAO|nr:hypothetical protein [Flavobacterium succinicans]SFM77819.1 hypothetical protein SAMN05444143_102184 [Flavobacterium succinicans]
MKLLGKNELNTYLDKESIWTPKRLVNKLDYISGITPFDELLNGKLFTEVVALINLRFRPKGLQIEIMKGISYYSVGILESNILSVNLDGQSQLSEQKNKSVIGRAIVGGLILGPVGAIVGGMTGIGQKQVATNMAENILSISYLENKIEKILLFSCKNKHRKEVDFFILKNYKSKFQITHSSNIKPIINNENDNIEKLEKLFQ